MARASMPKAELLLPLPLNHIGIARGQIGKVVGDGRDLTLHVRGHAGSFNAEVEFLVKKKRDLRLLNGADVDGEGLQEAIELLLRLKGSALLGIVTACDDLIRGFIGHGRIESHQNALIGVVYIDAL